MNTWSVSFDVPNTNSILVFALCSESCISSQYRLYECLAMLSTLGEQAWHNQYMSTHTGDGEMLCNAMRCDMRSNAGDIQNVVDKILTVRAGGALVRLRHPNTLIIFYICNSAHQYWQLERQN
jgi:hypothetical protein